MCECVLRFFAFNVSEQRNFTSGGRVSQSVEFVMNISTELTLRLSLRALSMLASLNGAWGENGKGASSYVAL